MISSFSVFNYCLLSLRNGALSDGEVHAFVSLSVCLSVCRQSRRQETAKPINVNISDSVIAIIKLTYRMQYYDVITIQDG